MSIFLISFVHPYIEPVKNCRGAYLVMAEVDWNTEEGKLDHYGQKVCFGRIHDDDYIDRDALLEAMYGKTVYEAKKIFNTREFHYKY